MFALTTGSLPANEGPVGLIHYLSQLLAERKATIPNGDWEAIGLSEKEASEMWPDMGILFLQRKLSEVEVFTRIVKHGYTEDASCEAHFFFSALSRAKGDRVEEIKHLQAALATKAYTNQCFSLATLRFRELSTAKK
jgi:ABC-type phosphate/phosphonate transport system ATPase subunit